MRFEKFSIELGEGEVFFFWEVLGVIFGLDLRFFLLFEYFYGSGI